MKKEEVCRIAETNNLPVSTARESRACCIFMQKKSAFVYRKGLGCLGKKSYVADMIPDIHLLIVWYKNWTF